MDITPENKEVISILLTALIGALAWFCKELIDTPIKQSRETFFKILEKRIGTLTELYNYTNAIALFPENKSLKKDLQKIILSDKMAYIDEALNTNIIEIAFKEDTDENLLLTTRAELQKAIAQSAHKIQQENQHFISNDTPNPYIRTIIYFKQFAKVVFFVALIIISIFYCIKLIITLPLWFGYLFMGIVPILTIRFFIKSKSQQAETKHTKIPTHD